MHIEGNCGYYPRPPETTEEEAAAKDCEEDEMVRKKTKIHTAVLPHDVKPHKSFAELEAQK